MKRLYVISLLFCFAPFIAKGQSGQFSQFYSSAIFVNPAFAGSNPYLSARLNFNSSKLAADGSMHELSQATVSYPIYQNTSKKYQVGGAGLTFFNEKQGLQGAFSTQKILLAAAYSLKLDRVAEKNLIFGLQGGVVQNRVSMDGLRWASQYNPYIGFDNSLDSEDLGNLSSYYPVFNFGILYSSVDHQNALFRDRSFIAGLSVDNLNSPRRRIGDFYQAENPLVFKLISTAKFILKPKTYIHPSVLAVYTGQSYQVNLGTYLSHQVNSPASSTAFTLQTGAWYRVLDSFILLAGIKVNDISTGVSYNFNTNNFGGNEIYGQINPSFEISVGYDFNFTSKPSQVNNPLF